MHARDGLDLRKAAIGPGNDILASDDLGEPHDAVGDQLRMFDSGGVVGHDAGNQDLARRQLDLFPDTPFVLVTHIGGLDRIRAGVYLPE